MASSRKSRVLVGRHNITRSEFEDGLLRDNARFDNRLNHEMRGVDKAKKVVVREYDKESQMMKKKMQSAALRKPVSYSNQTSPPKGANSKTSSKAPLGRLIPDYEYRQYRAKQNGELLDSEKDVLDEPTSNGELIDNGSEGPENGELVDGSLLQNGKDELDAIYVSPKRTKPPEAYWNNLSTPRNQSNVREVRERLAREFGKPKPSQNKTKGATSMPRVQGTTISRK